MEINEDKISFLKDLKKLVTNFWENVDELNAKHQDKIIHPNCYSSWRDLIQNLKFSTGNEADKLRKRIFSSINNDIRKKLEGK